MAESPKLEVATPSADVVQLDGDYGRAPSPRVGGGARNGGKCLWLSGKYMPLLVVHSVSSDAVGRTSVSRGGGLEHTVQYARFLLFDGLPDEWVGRMQDVMDMRLSASSMRTLEAGMLVWRIVENKYCWEPIINTDDRRRAAKLATLVLYSMLDETTLAYGSISLYLWGVRQHMVLHRQADPIYGVPNWREFMSSIQVLAHTQAEPRRDLPMEVIRLILEDTDDASFVDVNFAFFIVVLLFTFSRSETPCAKTFAGFDPAQHWQSKDIRWRCVDAVYCFAVRFKLIN